MKTDAPSTTSSSSETNSDLQEAERWLDLYEKSTEITEELRVQAERAFAKIGRPMPLFDRLKTGTA